MTTRNSDPSEKILHSQHIRKLWRMGIMPAAAITVFIVTYALILPAITMSSQNAHCGCEEHAHSPVCYGEQGELVCGLEEHAHSLDCYSDPDADIENADIWQQELPELTGDRSADVLAVAKSLLGYRESDKNYLVAEGGETKGYTRFGHWYGLTIADIPQEEADDITAEDSASMRENGIPDYSYWDWDAMFASYVLSYAGAGDMGADTDAHKWAESLAAAGLYVDPSSYIPSDGDLVFFAPYADEPAMVGIVSNVNKNFFGLGDRVNSISVICGDFDNEVSEIRISMDEYREGDLTSEIIQGYGLLNPDAPSENLADDASKMEANADAQDNLQDQIPADTHVADEAAMALEGDQSAADAAAMLLEGDQSSADQTDLDNDLANADESDLSNYEQPESDQSSDSANENTSVPDNMACTLLPGETQTLTANGNDYTVTMTYGAESEIPDISKLQIKEIKAGTDDYEECLADTRETLGIDEADADKLHGRFFDIKIMTKEGEFEPKSPVKVEISYKKPIEASEASDFHAIHFGEDGTERIDVETSEKNDKVTAVEFAAESFSIYGVVYTVDFHWVVDGETYGEYSIAGGDSISFRELVQVLHILDKEEGHSNDGVNKESDEENVPEQDTESAYDVDVFVGDADDSSDVLESEIDSVEDTDSAYDNAVDILVGDAEGSFDEELEKFMADVEDVTFSNDSLVKVVPVKTNMTAGGLKETWNLECEYSAELTEEEIQEMNNKTYRAPDWALVSLKAFDTEESLTVTMKTGESFQIKVTDAQISRDFISASGDRYKISVLYNDKAKIPDGAELRVEEILPVNERYEEYLNGALKAISQQSEADRENEKYLTEEEVFVENTDEETSSTASESAIVEYARFFDIKIWTENREFEPNAPVTVKIELSDAPEEHLNVVHFEGDEETPALMDADVISTSDIRVETDSFSTYGVIVENPSTTPSTLNVNDLNGKSFKIKHNARYLVSDSIANNGTNPALLSNTTNAESATIWYFEGSGTTGEYYIYTIISGQKKYLTMTPTSLANDWVYPADLTLQDKGWNATQQFTVDADDSDFVLYTKQAYNNADQYYYLDNWNGTNFAGSSAHGNNNPNDANKMTLESTYPEVAGEDYFVLLKGGDDYYIVLNDGRLEKVTWENTPKFTIQNDPMMWQLSNIDGYQYLSHTSFAREIEQTFKYQLNHYYSYINPNEQEYGFSDPHVTTPFDKDAVIEEYKATHSNAEPSQQYIADKQREFYENLHSCDVYNSNLKANSRITIVESDGKRYIKSATTDNYIGLLGSDDNASMVGCVTAEDAAEVYFAKPSDITKIIDGETSDLAQNNVVNHIDIGIESTAMLHILLKAGTYYLEDGTPVTFNTPQLLRVSQKVPINEQDIKNADLTAYTINPNTGEKTYENNVYFITGYSGNAATNLSAVQVRIEGQFKVSKADINHTDYYEQYYWSPYTLGDNTAALTERLENRVYYNIVVKKDVSFELKLADGTQLYNASGDPLTSTTLVELSASFDYWSKYNECPSLHVDQIAKNDYLDGWLDPDTNLPRGIIPSRSYGNSGMDFILGGSKDQTAVVITKFIENTDGTPIALQEETTSIVDILQKDIDPNNPRAETDKVSDPNGTLSTVREKNYHNPALSSVYGSNYSDYKSVVDDKVISIGTEGYGTVYDFDVPNGMVGIEEDKGSIPQTIIDKNGIVWTYSHTYIKTDYVNRKESDGDDKYHYTKKYYLGTDNRYLSYPDVLGPYERDENHYDEETEQYTIKDTSDFLEFYVHNVYTPEPIEVEVEKEWKQGSATITPPAGADVDVDVQLKRYKLVNKSSFNQQTDKYVIARVNIYSAHYDPYAVWYSNATDFNAGDNLTINFSYQYNAPNLRYRINDGAYVTLEQYTDATKPANTGPDGFIPMVITIPVPDDGVVAIYFDDEWNSVGQKPITVESDHAGRNGAASSTSQISLVDENGIPYPPSPADKPDMIYQVDSSWEGVWINDIQNRNWESKTEKNLPAYDENGNEYLYFISSVNETGAPAGTKWIIAKDTNGSYMTSTGDATLKVTNQVPSKVTLYKKDSDDQSALVGAKFRLYQLNKGTWDDKGEIDMSSVTNKDITGLFDSRYKLVETEAPFGHKLLEQEIYFKVVSGIASLTDASGDANISIPNNMIIIGSNNSLTVKNKPYKTNIKIDKIDQTTRNTDPVSLSGAYFRLYKRNSSDAYVASDVSNYGNEDGVETVNGTLTFSDLTDGEYKVEEIQPPKGYVKTANNDIYFTLSRGVVTRHTAPDPINSTTWTEIAVSSSVADITYIKASGDIIATFTVGNTPGAALPSTGGGGTALFYLAGLILTAFAGLGMMRMKKA